MDLLMSLHKYLNMESVSYLSQILAKLDLLQHNEHVSIQLIKIGCFR